MQLQSVKITQFWGEYNVEFKLDKKMNIFIGKNGSGKTQILNLIEAAITCDIDTLYRVDFDTIEIAYLDKKRIRKIGVEKRVEKNIRLANAASRNILSRYAGIIYYLDEKGWLILDSQGGRSNLLIETAQNENLDLIPYEGMRDILSRSFNIVVLNVHRSNRSGSEEEVWVTHGRRKGVKDNLSERIEVILSRITSEQVKLKDELATIAKEGEKQFVSSLLFSDNSIQLQLRSISREELSQKRDILEKTMQEMGILDDEVRENINSAFFEMNSIADKDIHKVWAERSSKKGSVDNISNILRWMSLISKLEVLSGVSSQIEKRKNTALRSWNLYLSKLSDFMGGKYFDFDENGKFRAFIGKRSVDINQLSSGEKQIFVMLSEAYLENRGDHIFLADEPELSLHLEWQQNIIPAMQELNANAQYIIVTHSLEIAGSYPKNIIDMDEVIV